MPRTWSPKKFNHPASDTLGDLVLIEADLEFVMECADHLLKNVSVFGDIRVVNALTFPDRAILNAAVIAYRRCFATGVRSKLSPPDSESEFGNLSVHHSYFMELASKHIAHSVNRFEEHSIGVDVGHDENGDIAIGSVRLGSAGAGGASELQVAALRELCITLLRDQVRPGKDRLKTEIMAAFEKLSKDEIKALPDGLAAYQVGAADVAISRAGSRTRRAKAPVTGNS